MLQLQVLYFSVILISLLVMHFNFRHEPIDLITLKNSTPMKKISLLLLQ